MIGALEGYPFHRMTERYTFRAVNHGNWKVFSDAFQSAAGTSRTATGRRRTTRTCSRATFTSCRPGTLASGLANEYAALTFKEYALQDCGTLDGTQMGLEQRAFRDYPLNDQEILVRHFHKKVGDWVDAYLREQAGESPR
jgi:hypothetical protein